MNSASKLLLFSLIVSAGLPLSALGQSKNVPAEILAVVVNHPLFAQPHMMKMTRDDQQGLRSAKAGNKVLDDWAYRNASPAKRAFLVMNGYAVVETFQFGSRTASYLLYTDKMKQLLTRLGAREEYGTTYLPVARRRIKSIDFANAYKGAPDGVEKQYSSFTFTYELAKITSDFPSIDTLFKGKATLELSPEDGEWHITKLDLSDFGEDRHKVFAIREPYVDHMGEAIEAHYAKHVSQYAEGAVTTPPSQSNRDLPAAASPEATSLEPTALARGRPVNATPGSAEEGYKLYTAGEYVKAAKKFAEAAAAGNARAAGYLGTMYKDGQGVPKDINKAVSLLEQSARGGELEAAFVLGEIYSGGQGIGRNKSVAQQWYETAFAGFSTKANGGDAEAMYWVARLHFSGSGAPVDLDKCVSWLRRASDAGHASATRNLGEMYLRGTGVPRNRSEAIRLLRIAAQKGEVTAQEILRTQGQSW